MTWFRCPLAQLHHFRKHPHYLNGRFIFLVMSQTAVGLSYGFRNVMLDRFVFKWNIANQVRLIHLFLTSIPTKHVIER